ncbi:unnamed protein product [Notodromas monacha]|uniref:Trehalase n=1 Tax=Notodromas monacha TaxID=399045 RepID=A0A7R9BV37_9CRUS|nr:unnamed protein product [Notodromas monacha]CAG0922300.1 unnamed protein product [Notodromas monacha]
MTTTAKGMLENFVALIEEFGLVPNGGRTYYTKRSQPPFLIPMVKLYMDHMEELKRRDPNVTSPSFAFDYITALEDEFQFWVKRRSVNVSVNGENVTMFAYGTNSTGPRPEEMSDDLNVSSNLKGRVKEEFFVDIKTTCESGWDFSSHNNEDDPEAQKYFQLSEKISDGIMKLMYDKETGSWYDYDFINKRQRKNFYASNAWPLWMDCIGTGTNKTELGLQFLSYLEKENVTTYPGGLPASKFENTGFAWDHPHGYAPLVHSMVTALSSVDHPKTKAAAFGFAQKWVDMSYSAYVKSQSMFHSLFVLRASQSCPGGVPQDDDAHCLLSVGIIAKDCGSGRTKAQPRIALEVEFILRVLR